MVSADLLQEAVGRIREGDRAGGRQLLVEILSEEPDNDDAWLWMAAVVEGEDLQRECLEEALKHNPRNDRARRALQKLAGEPEPEADAPEGKGDWLRRRRRYNPPTTGHLALLFILAAASLFLALYDLRNELRLRNQGVVVQAQLTEATVLEEAGGPVHAVKYAFTAADGQRYTASQTLSGPNVWMSLDEPVWNEVVARATLPVVYVPDDPWTNRPAIGGPGISTLFAVGIFTAVLVVLLTILLYVFGVPTYQQLAEQ